MERASWLAALTGLALLTFFALTIDRVPLPWNDEIYNASAVLSLVNGGDGTPTVLPPGRWSSFPRVYGPLYFRFAAALSPAGTVTATSIRLPCLAGAALIGLSTAWLAAGLGATAAWAAMAFAIVLAAPDLTSIATNGRVDSLAIGFQLAGLAAFAHAAGVESTPRRAALSVTSGLAWGASMLTSPRVFPSLGAIALCAAGLWRMPDRDRRRALAAAAASAAVAAAIYFAWTFSTGWGAVGHVEFLRNAARGDWFNSPVAGEPRQWGLYLRPMVTFVAAAITALIAATSPADRSLSSLIARLSVAAAVLTTLYWIATANHTFFHGAYFTLPLIATALAAAPRLTGGARRVSFGVWALVAAAFLAVDAGKVLEAVRSRERSNPAAVRAFVAEQVPPGSTVYGPDRDYFYAVENSGSHFRTAWVKPYPSDNLGVASQATVVEETGAHQYLLWPVGEKPPADPCLRGIAIATFHAPRARPPRIPLAGRIVRETGYADTNLFVLERGCAALSDRR